MAKKGNRPSKANQQRSREEQWRRRAAAQAGGATSVVDNYSATAQDGVGLEDEAEFTTMDAPADALVAAPATTASTRATQPRAQGSAASATAAQRRAGTANRQSRARYAPNVMSLEDEMYYVRSDIRRLVLLSAACVVVLIVLFFIIPR